MDWKFYLGIFAGVISFIAYVFYIKSILKRKTKPSRTTWWIWSLMGLVLFLSYLFSGAENTIWVPFVEFIGPLSIAIFSIKYGEGGLDSKTDLICLAGAIISIIVWIIFNNPVVALITNLFIDSFALIPTIKKSYLRPDKESFKAWFGTWVADTLNLFAVEKISFALLVYPVYMFISDTIVIIILKIKKKKV